MYACTNKDELHALYVNIINYKVDIIYLAYRDGNIPLKQLFYEEFMFVK